MFVMRSTLPLFTTALADGTIPHLYIINKILYGVVFIALLIQLALRNRTSPLA